MTLTPVQQQSLLTDAIGGDRVALQTLLLHCYPQIEATVRSKFNPQLAEFVEPEDLIQEVLIKIHRSVGSYRQLEHNCFEAWLRTITVNCIRDAARLRGRVKRGGRAQRIVNSPGVAGEPLDTIWDWVSSDSQLPERDARRSEARQAIQVCLAQLNAAQREAVVAHYFGHLNVQDIASQMDRTPGAVRELLRRARERLQELLGTASTWLSHR